MAQYRSDNRRWFLRVFAVAFALAGMFAVVGTASAVGQQLAFVQQPSDSLAGQPIAPPVTVAVQDANGQLVPTSTARITVALVGGGSLFGTRTVNAVNGVATFPDLIVVPAGTYRLAATAGSKITGAESDAFTVTGIAVDCSKVAECSASTGDIKNLTSEDPIVGFVRVQTNRCTTQTCFLTVDEDPECPPDIDCRGSAFLFIPPGNARNVITGKLGCDVSLCPVDEPVRTFKQRTDGTWIELAACPSANPTEAEIGDGCILSQERTSDGDLVTTVLVPPNDPRLVGS